MYQLAIMMKKYLFIVDQLSLFNLFDMQQFTGEKTQDKTYFCFLVSSLNQTQHF